MSGRVTACLVAASLLLAVAPAAAQGAGRDVEADAQTGAIVIIDASRSTAARLVDRSKLEAERFALAELLQGTAPRRLALMAYGGPAPRASCAAPVVLSPGTALDAGAAGKLAASLEPGGRTPLAAAIDAASGLAGDATSVAILTDGLDTCGGDPCAAAERFRAAHPGARIDVVAIDLGWPPDRRALACIPDKTGGRLLRADTPREVASRLAEALAAPPARPAVRRIALKALAADGKAASGAAFNLVRPDGEVAATQGASAEVSTGLYRLVASAGDRFGQADTVVTATGPAELAARLTERLPRIVLSPPDGVVVAGGRVTLAWTGKGSETDDLRLVRADGAPTETRSFVRAGGGPSATLPVPDEPGAYEALYVHGPTQRVLSRVAFEVRSDAATVVAPPSAKAGATISVAWTGPQVGGDSLVVVPPGSLPGFYLPGGTAAASDGMPARLLMPAVPGRYEIRYVTGDRPRVLAAAPIEVMPAGLTLTAPSQAMAGAPVPVTVAGEAMPGAFLAIIEPDQPDANTIRGATATPDAAGKAVLTAPGKPGTYELRDVLDGAGGHAAAVRRPLVLTPPAATLMAPESVRANEGFEVRSTGPGGPGDVVALARTDAPPEAAEGTLTDANGQQGRLWAPAEPGAYELRYVMDAPLTGKVVLARKALTVTR